MKRIAITTITTLLLATSYGQIGGLLGKAKDKATKAADKTTDKAVDKATAPVSTGSGSGSSSGSSSSGSSTTSSGSNTHYHQVQASPAHYEITNIEYMLSGMKTKGIGAFYDEDFVKGQEYIDKIKTKDATWKVDGYQKELNDYKVLYDKDKAQHAKEGNFNWIVMDAADRATSNFRNGAYSKYSYADYMAGRDDYEKSPTSDYKKMIPDADRYYNEMYPKYVEENVIPEMKKEYPYDFNEERHKLDPDGAIYGIKQQIAKVDQALFPLKPGVASEAQLKTFKSTFEANKKKYEDYKSSGEFDKFKTKHAAEQLAKVRFPKVLSSNPTWEAAAKREVTGYFTSGVTIQRVGVCTNAWIIKKNDYDLPVYRYQYMTVAFKKNSDGKCYMVDVFVQQDYAGGGTWNSGYKYSLNANDTEILCENVSK